MGYSWWDYGEWSKKEIDMVKGGKLTNPCDENGLYLHCVRSIPGCIIWLLQMLPLKKIGQRIHGICIISYKCVWICNYLKTKSYLWKKSLGKPNSIRLSRYNLTCNTEFQLPNILHIEVMFHSYNYGFPPWQVRCMEVTAISTLFAIVLPVLCLNLNKYLFFGYQLPFHKFIKTFISLSYSSTQNNGQTHLIQCNRTLSLSAA